MYTRDSVNKALRVIGASDSEDFNWFIREIRSINPYSVYTTESMNVILKALFDKTRFHNVLSYLSMLYVELSNTGEQTDRPLVDIYAELNASSWVKEHSNTWFRANVAKNDPLIELIVTLCIYR